MKNNAKTYRLPETTTPENLACSWSCTLDFGNKVLLAGYYYSGRNANSYYGAVYEYTTDDHTCEGEIRLNRGRFPPLGSFGCRYRNFFG